MDNLLERSMYLEVIAKLLDKKGEKVNINGYLVNEEDVEELKKALTAETILYNKKMFLENTNSFKERVLLRLTFLSDSDAIIEKEALNNILNILNETPKTRIEELSVYKKVLIPSRDIDKYIENLNKTILGRAKPLRDASKEDLEDLTLDVTLSQNQHKRINQYLEMNNTNLDNYIEDLDISLENLNAAKEDAMEMLTGDLQDTYENYLNKCLFDSCELDNEVAIVYYEEMLNRYKNTRVVEELGYLYTKKDALL